MLRTGEYSPNNPELAGDGRTQRGGDVFLGFGLYEEKRKKLLQRRQIEYREYLAKQNEINTLKKQQKHNRLPAGRHLFLEEEKKILSENSYEQDDWNKINNNYNLKPRRPSSVAVQTDPEEFALMVSDRKLNNAMITQAERELSPRPSINDNLPPADWRMHVEKVNIGTQNNLIVPPSLTNKKYMTDADNAAIEYNGEYYDPFNDMSSNIFRKDSPRAKLLQDLRHTYMPSLFDSDAIKQRNQKVEEDAAAKRTAYQFELKKQIEEQQKLREERKVREKMLEEAETRRLEEQLKLLKLSQENEIQKQNEIAIKMRNDANEFERRRQQLQSDIETEKRNLRNVKMKSVPEPAAKMTRSNPNSRTSEPVREQPSSTKSSLPFHYAPPPRHNPEPDTDLLSYNVRRNNPYVGQDLPRPKLAYSTNIADSSMFAQSIPVKNYNAEPKAESTAVRPLKFRDGSSTYSESVYNSKKPNYEPAFLSKRLTDMIEINPTKRRGDHEYRGKFDDSLPIPVLREPEKKKDKVSKQHADQSSDAMINLEHKWKVPAVQKNILKNNFTDEGKQENILTQLGSIRRQLQLEQLKLDQSQIFNKQKLVK
ncbi:uncharacterized protein LOC143916731 isoform X2 [Arctopsyche grandis]